MSGILVIAGVGLGAGGGGGTVGGDATLNPLNWSNISGSFSGSNETLTISGINTPVTLSIVPTGAGEIYSVKNGVSSLAGPTLTVVNANTLSWLVIGGGSTVSGTVTITNLSDGGAAVDSFSYDIFTPF